MTRVAAKSKKREKERNKKDITPGLCVSLLGHVHNVHFITRPKLFRKMLV